MKKAFTLAEVLVTLVIIGIIAALTLPAISRLMPDTRKIKYLRAYDSLSKVVTEASQNTKLFPVVFTNKFERTPEDPVHTWDVSKCPFVNINKVEYVGRAYGAEGYINSFEASRQAVTKFCEVMAFYFDAQPGYTCPMYGSMWTPNFEELGFIDRNGFKWWFHTGLPILTEYCDYVRCNANNEYCENMTCGEYTIPWETIAYVDIDPSPDSPNCIFQESTPEELSHGRVICTNPDRFAFFIEADGTVLPADPLGKAYLKTRKHWLKQDLDVHGDPDIWHGHEDRIMHCKVKLIDAN